MKRIVLALAVPALLFGLAACSEGGSDATTTQSTETEAVEEGATETQAQPEQPAQTE